MILKQYSNFMSKQWWIYLFSLLVSIPCFFSSFVDDAYIHARIVNNFLEHGAFIYNVGDIGKIDSSTFYVMLLSGLSYFFGPLLSIRMVQSVTLFVFFVVFLNYCMRQEKKYLLLFAAVCASPSLLVAAYIGMETSLACLCLLLTYLKLEEEKYDLAICCASLAACLRFEMIMLLLIVMFFSWRNNHVTRKTLFYCLPFIFITCYELYSFGTILPHAALAKSIGYNHPFMDSFLRAVKMHVDPVVSLFTVPVYAFLGYRVYIFFKNKMNLEIMDVFSFFSLGIIAMWALGKSSIFLWYKCQLSMALLCVFMQLFKNMHTIRAPYAKSLPCLFLLYFVFVLNLSYMSYLTSNSKEGPNVRVETYLQIGALLSKVFPQGTLITSEVGGLGFAYDGKLLDAFGLSDPDAVRYHPLKVPEERSSYSVGAIPPRYVVDKKPDFVVSMPLFVESFAKSVEAQTYHQYFCPFPKGVEIWGDTGVRIYSKVAISDADLSAIQCQGE